LQFKGFLPKVLLWRSGEVGLKMKFAKACLFGAAMCFSAAWAVGPASAVVLPALVAGASDQVAEFDSLGNLIFPGPNDSGVLGENTENTTNSSYVSILTLGPSFAGLAVKITEADGTGFSDLAWVDSQGHIVLTSADENGNFAPGTPAIGDLTFFTLPVAETGDFQDIGLFFDLPNRLFVASDLESTPLPAALPLFVGGAGFLGFMAKRRKRKAAVAVAG
jgi:hypothetical protein